MSGIAALAGQDFQHVGLGVVRRVLLPAVMPGFLRRFGGTFWNLRLGISDYRVGHGVNRQCVVTGCRFLRYLRASAQPEIHPGQRSGQDPEAGENGYESRVAGFSPRWLATRL